MTPVPASKDHEISRGDIDGVPVFWCEGPGTFTGALLFRTGRADEDLKTGGITHIVEHLAFHPFNRLPHPIGGFVDDTRTVFHASGTPQEAGAFLSGICANLGRLQVDRLTHERRVLRAEAQSSGAIHPLWPMRFGPRKHGLLGFPEYGLEWLLGDEVQQWSDTRFTRENAVLWFSGPPPENLQIELPTGSRLIPPKPETLPGLTLPAWSPSSETGVSVSLLVRRSTNWTALTALLSEKLQDLLRRELGLTYGVGATYWRLDRDWAHVIIGADAAPGQGQAVRDGLLEVLDQFAHEGPATADLERYVTLAERYRYDPDAIQGLLDTHASDELVGARTPSAEQISEELRALTPDSMARQFRPALEGMIALVPPGLGLDATRARVYQVGPKIEPIRGTDYNPQTPGSDETITVGKEGVSRRVGNHVVTIRFEDCVLVALEGEFAVTLISSNGESIWFQYRGDKAKKQILGAIEAGVPGNRILRVDQEVQERLERVMALADTKLGDRKGWALTVLPRVLFEGETTLNLARANWANESGLLVVTDARVLLIDEAGDRLLVEVPREQIVGADAGRGLRKGHVMIDDGQTQHRFTSVAPGSRAAEIRDELSG